MVKPAGTVPLLPAMCGFIPLISVAGPRGAARRFPGGESGPFSHFWGQACLGSVVMSKVLHPKCASFPLALRAAFVIPAQTMAQIKGNKTGELCQGGKAHREDERAFWVRCM